LPSDFVTINVARQGISSMPAPHLSVQLSKFEQLEILRSEIEARQEELKKADSQVREILYEMERQRYLQGIHPLFQQLTPPAEAANLAQWNAHRDALTDALQFMESTLNALQAETAGQSAPPSRGLSRPGAAAPAAAPGAPRRKFDSFDDFKANKAGG
jgi:hypothetical protein